MVGTVTFMLDHMYIFKHTLDHAFIDQSMIGITVITSKCIPV